MFHYTTTDGGKAIGSQVTWHFRAVQPPGDHPKGAYFTTLQPNTPRLAERLRIPKRKTEYVFEFTGQDGLKPLDGGRGQYIFFAEQDYDVGPRRQRYKGSFEEALIREKA